MAELVEKLQPPRAVWIMVPAGDATEAQIEELMEHLAPGDTIVDGGNTNFHDDQRRHPILKGQGVHYVDAGRLGRDLGPRQRLLPDGRRRAGAGAAPRARVPDARARGRLSPRGRPGLGHYVKMVHNGIEYGLMQAYAEGFEIMHASDYTLDLPAISKLWNHGSVVRSWLLELAERAFSSGPGPDAPQGLGRGLGRGPLDGPGGDRPGRAGARDHARRC